ncbi:MAG TPA: type II toxin-antitoxin system RelE/ParE family toxin [Candidatus Hydrogenedentes bacterium]|nr:type II toxin-antitoxin system RelE/ParE family toxin [Candidatus Hydrogenedentota bacterium]HQM51316.1 type II toxin-antitoxin system RelE/ParE family toxin [Candidatus Hydrogenedentota bacterium]
MYIEFKTRKLRKQCESFAALRNAYGEVIARQVVKRLNALKAADCIEDLDPLPPVRCHALKGNRQGQYAMNVGQPFRLIFEPLDETRTTREERGARPECGVRILGIEDYHG